MGNLELKKALEAAYRDGIADGYNIEHGFMCSDVIDASWKSSCTKESIDTGKKAKVKIWAEGL